MSEISRRIWAMKYGEDPYAFSDYFSNIVECPMSMENRQKLEGHRGCINTCSFNPYGDRLITGCDDGCTYIWDIGSNSSQPKYRLRPHATNLFTTNFLTGNRYISGANDANVNVVTLTETGARCTTYFNHHIRKVVSSFVIDQNIFVTAGADNTIRIFDIRQNYSNSKTADLPLLTDEDLNYNAHERLTGDLERFGLRPQGGGGGKIEPVTDICNDSLLIDFGSAGSQLFQLDVHPIDRKQFVASGNDGTVRLFDLRSIPSPNASSIPHVGFSVRATYNGGMEITGCSFNDDGTMIAASVLGGNIHIFETASAEEIKAFTPVERERRRMPPLTHFIDADGVFHVDALERMMEQLAAEEGEEEEEEPPMEAGCVRVLKGHRSVDTIKACNWLGRYVVSGSDDGIIYLYDVDKAKVVKVLRGHENHVNVTAVHREKKLLATSGIDSYAMLWAPGAFSNLDKEAIEQDVQMALSQPSEPVGRCNIA